jgi:hypothetical protein
MNVKKKPSPNSLKNLRPPWKKGDVPNPKGVNRKRPITDRYFGRAEDPLPEKIRKKFKLEEGATWGDALALRQFSEAVMKGSTAAAKEIREAIEGKSPQRLEISGPERKEITIRVIYENGKP